MSLTGFHHGTRLTESSETPVLVRIANTAVVGLIGTAPDADPTKFPANTPILIPGDPSVAVDLGANGTLADALDDVFDQVFCNTVVVRVEEGADEAGTLANIIGSAATQTGLYAFLNAQQVAGARPRIIAAPGFTGSNAGAANPVVAELPAILDQLNAVAYVDGPDSTLADAISYRSKMGSGRLETCGHAAIVYDRETATNVTRPASARFAGIRARTDLELGFWHSSSNKKINGIVGTSRVIQYPKETNLYNENHISCIANFGAGFVTWGNRSTTDDDLWQFLCVRRTADFINEALQEAYLEFVDKPFSAANLKLMVESGNAAMRRFKAEGAIIGGRVWIDESHNQPTDLAAGRVRLSVDFEPPAPMEDIGFIAYRNIQYYLDLTKEAIAQAA